MKLNWVDGSVRHQAHAVLVLPLSGASFDVFITPYASAEEEEPEFGLVSGLARPHFHNRFKFEASAYLRYGGRGHDAEVRIATGGDEHLVRAAVERWAEEEIERERVADAAYRLTGGG